ncbi:MAG: CoxG family protein [Polyangiales bacterium]
MPEVEYATTMELEPETIWNFVKDMNNWAPFLTGYQSHEVLNETDSIWTLKGDVGVLVRSIRMKVHITEWNGPERVSFTLTGLNEEMEGGGTFVMGRVVATATSALAKPIPPGIFRRFIDAIFRFFFRKLHGGGPARSKVASATASELKFTLRMDAGGPTAPLVNAMLGPALKPAAEDLANKIAAHLEKTHAAKVA